MAFVPHMIEARDKASARFARADEGIYHLTLVVYFPEEPKRARYIGPFVELAGLEQKIQETAQDFNTVIPSGAFLSEMLNAPVSGLSGIEEVHIPFRGIEGSVSFYIKYEKQTYIKTFIQGGSWSFEKQLYTVVVDTLKIWTNDYETDEQYVAKVEAEATFSKMSSAVARVNDIVNQWDKEVGNEGKIIPVDDDSVRGVMTSSRDDTELKRVHIITRTLWQAGALKGAGVQATMMAPGDRDGFAKRTLLTDLPEKERAAFASAGAAKLNSSTKRTAASMGQDIDAEDTPKRLRVSGPDDQEARDKKSVAMPLDQNDLEKCTRSDVGVGQGTDKDPMHMAEHVDSGAVEYEEAN